MRLSERDRETVVRVTAEAAGPGARVLLFGSRTRDDLRGGDIDLLVELPTVSPNRLALGDRIGARLQRIMGLRRIDVLVADPATPDSPVLRAARRDGIELSAAERAA
ncbi:MAG: nucleotidyltransferase domain-containing protein [Rubrivivax sp.]|nr:nucleotidyltransferase domain-containing protein [Rubrivivax sp.]